MQHDLNFQKKMSAHKRCKGVSQNVLAGYLGDYGGLRLLFWSVKIFCVSYNEWI